MASSIQILRSNTAKERPFPGNLLDGQPALNTNSEEPGLFFKGSDGSIVKIGPAAITSDGNPPNTGGGGQLGNTIGELWLDKSAITPILKVYDGAQWVDAGSGGGGGGQVTLLRWSKLATAGQTVLSGADSSSQQLAYTAGFEEVYVNGAFQRRGLDYVATNGTTISLLSSLSQNDEVSVLAWTPFSVGNVNGADILDGSITSPKIQDGTLLNADINSNANISTSKILYTPSIGLGSEAKTLQELVEEGDYVNVRDFGAKGDGVTPDTAAIQAAVDTGKDVYFPPGLYILDNTVTGNTRAQVLFGGTNSGIAKGEINSGAIIQSNFNDGRSQFTFTLSQVKLQNLTFRGVTSGSIQTSVLFEKLTNTDDIDPYVIDCWFTRIRTAIHVVGRAIAVTDCYFSNIPFASIILDWPSSGTSGGAIQTDPLYANRACRIVNNRFHGVQAAIIQRSQQPDFLLRGAIITDNSVDIGNGRLILVETGLQDCVIANNIVHFSALSPIQFQQGAKCIKTVISGNSMSGAEDAVSLPGRRPFNCVWFRSPALVEDVVISNNTMSYTTGYAIAFTNDEGGSPITIKNVSVIGNTFRNIGLDGNSIRSVLLSTYDIDGLIFLSNNISNVTLNRIIRTESNVVSNSIIRNNVWPSTIPLFTSTSFSGSQSIDWVEGVYSVNSTGGFEIKNGSNLILPNAAWNNSLFRLGTNRLWVDASGRLRIKAGSDPTSDIDGTIVGTQS